MITTFLARMTPSCKDVAALASNAMDRPLPFAMRVKLRLHYWICVACARYRDQLLLIRKAVQRGDHPEAGIDRQAPSRESQKRLSEAFRAKHR